MLKLTPIHCTSSSRITVRVLQTQFERSSQGMQWQLARVAAFPLFRRALEAPWQLPIFFDSTSSLSPGLLLHCQTQLTSANRFKSPKWARAGWQMSCASSWASPHFQPDKKTEEKLLGTEIKRNSFLTIRLHLSQWKKNKLCSYLVL